MGKYDRIRFLAWEVLQAVSEDDAYANLLLPPRLERAGVVGRDAAFATELTYGTLRNQIYYDWVIEQCSERPIEKLESAVRNVLRMGAHQILNMRVPNHAAANETVNLAREVSHEGSAKLVNFMLRQMMRIGEEGLAERLAQIEPLDRRLSIKYSHPEWIIAAYRMVLQQQQARGEQIAADDQALEKLLAANNRAPLVHLVARPSLIDRVELAKEAQKSGWRTSETMLSPYGLVLASGDPGQLPSVRQHRAAVEDQGSQILAALAASVPVTGSDENWLDLCAGPGGKAALMAAIGRSKTPPARLLANEVSEHRAQLVVDSCRALDNVHVICEDGRKLRSQHLFDRVLVDAPCTGLGALRRHPESRYRQRHSAIPDLTGLQQDLLRQALALTRPGGIVLYGTCSPHPAETVGVVTEVLKDRHDVAAINLRPVLQELVSKRAWTEYWADSPTAGKPFLQLWPHLHYADAMFAIALRKLS